MQHAPPVLRPHPAGSLQAVLTAAGAGRCPLLTPWPACCRVWRAVRTSWGTFLTRGQDEVIYAIEHRLANWTHLPAGHAGAHASRHRPAGRPAVQLCRWLLRPAHCRSEVLQLAGPRRVRLRACWPALTCAPRWTPLLSPSAEDMQVLRYQFNQTVSPGAVGGRGGAWPAGPPVWQAVLREEYGGGRHRGWELCSRACSKQLQRPHRSPPAAYSMAPTGMTWTRTRTPRAWAGARCAW